MTCPRASLFLFLSLSLAPAACQMPGDEDAALGASERPQITFNGWPFDAAAFNAMAGNPRALPIVTEMSLQEAVRDPYLAAQLGDPFARMFMDYLVGCALDPGQSLTWQPSAGAPVTALGDLGLCPDWQHGAPSLACQEVVSACILARNNNFGVSVPVSLRGRAAGGEPLAVDWPERADYPVLEGGFFGNLFRVEALSSGVDVRVDGSRVVYHVGGRDVTVFVITPNIDPVRAATRRRERHEHVMAVHPFHGVVFEDMYSCSGPGFANQPALARARVCAVAGSPDGCAAAFLGPCQTPCADAADDGGELVYQACQDDQGRAWPHPMTTYLQ